MSVQNKTRFDQIKYIEFLLTSRVVLKSESAQNQLPSILVLPIGTIRYDKNF